MNSMALKKYLGAFLICLSLTWSVYAQQEAESFNVYYSIDDVSCAGGDGAIRVDSFQCSVSGGGHGGGACYSGGTPMTYSCQDSYDQSLAGANQSAFLQNGKTYRIDGEYSGNIDFHGDAILYICGVARITSLNIDRDSKVIVFGELITTNLNVNSPSVQIFNYGKISVAANLNLAGNIKSYGEIYCKEAIALNSNTTFENYGTIVIGNSPEFGGPRGNEGNIRMNAPNTRFDNHGLLDVYSTFTINSQSVQLRNYCTIHVGNNMDINTSIPCENRGRIEVQGASTWNSVSLLFYPGSLYKTGSLTSGNALATNSGSACARLETGAIGSFNNNTFDGNMSLCFPSSYTESNTTTRNGAEKNCDCEADPGGSGSGGSGGSIITSANPSVFDIEWSGNLGDGRALTGLSGGLYEATIGNELCWRTIQFQVRDRANLAFQYGFQTPGCAGAKDGFIDIQASGGTPPYQYRFAAGEPWRSDNKLSGLSAGNYQLNVKDARGCEGEERLVALPDGVMGEGKAGIGYVACYADSNSAKILIEGEVVSILSDSTVTETDTSSVDFSRYSCFEGLSSIPYSCFDGVAITNNSYYSIGAGNTATLNNDFSGWIDIGGGTLIVCGDVTMGSLSLNNPNDRVIVLGTLRTTGIYMNSGQSQVYNYGVIDFLGNYVPIGGEVYNYGTMRGITGMTVNTGALLENYGPLTATGDVQIDTRFINYGPVTIGGVMGINSQGLLENHCTVQVTGKVSFTSNGQYIGYNTLTAAGELELNSVANVRLDNAILDVGFLRTSSDVTIHEVGIEGMGPYCSKVRARDGVYLNAFLSLNGALSLCVEPGATVTNQNRVVYQTPDAEWGCSCSRIGKDDLLVNNPNPGNGGGTSSGYRLISGEEGDTVLVGRSGVYVITYKDKNGCLQKVTANVRFPEKPSVSVIAADLSCALALNDGEIKLVYDRNEVARAELYKIEAPESNRLIGEGASFKRLFEGDYRVAFISPEGCALYDSVTIATSGRPCYNEDLDFDISPLVTRVSCDSFKVVVFDESPYGVESYRWILPGGAELKTRYNELGLSAEGTYRLFVLTRDEKGTLYEIEKEVIVAFPAALDFQYSVFNSLPDDNTGVVQILSVSGNSGDVAYSGPSHAANTPVFTGLGAGTYAITVSDQFCSVSKNVVVESESKVNPCGDRRYKLELDNISCFGANDGSASLSLMGSDADAITGKWYMREAAGLLSLNDSDTREIGSLTPGAYEVAATLLKDGEIVCVAENIPFEITEPEELQAQALVVKSPTYADSRNGEIYVSIVGGVNPVIAWTGENGEYKGMAQRTGLAPGVYAYLVVDDRQCQATRSVTLKPWCAMLSAADENKSCIPCNTEVEKGSPMTCLDPGDWSAMVCDNEPLCSRVGLRYEYASYECAANPGFVELKLDAPAGLALSVQKAEWYEENSCESLVEGLYLRGALAGAYEARLELTVDGAACVYHQRILLPARDTAVFIVSVADLPCPELSGSVSARVLGGVGSYDFSWIDPLGKALPVKGNRISADIAGEYAYTARGSSGCAYSGVATVGIMEEACDACDKVGLHARAGDVTCHGFDDGSITLYHSPEFEIEKLEWLSENQVYSRENQLFGLSQGVYELKADFKRKATGEICHVDQSYRISEPERLRLSASSLDLCKRRVGDLVSGGTGGYTYIWKAISGENSSDLSCISDGDYLLTIVDENTCFIDAQIGLRSSGCDQPATLCYTVSAKNTSCDNLGGEIHIADLSGATEYTLHVRGVNSAFSASVFVTGTGYAFSGVPRGRYVVEVEAMVEGETRKSRKDILVPSYFPPDYKVTVEPVAELECRALARAYPVAPVYGNYAFEWRTAGEGALISSIQTAMLENGLYSLTITDPFNPACSRTLPVEIGELATCDIDFNMEEEVTGCHMGEPVRTYSVRGGEDHIVAISWYFNGILLNKIDPFGSVTNILSEDSRTLRTSATNGSLEVRIEYYHNYAPRSTVLKHLISANQRYYHTIVSSGEPGCDGEGRVSLSVSGTVDPALLSYAWYKVSGPDGLFAPLVEYGGEVSLSAGGDFAVVVNLPDGCADTLYKSVKPMERKCACEDLKYTVTATPLGCGGENGALTFTLHDQDHTIESLSWTYRGERIGAEAALTGLAQKGLYTLNAYVDAGGERCRVDTEALLESAPPIQVSLAGGVAPSCSGLADGYVHVSVNGGSGKYAFEDPLGNPLDIESLASGEYTIVVRDRNHACHATFSATVPEALSEACSGYTIAFAGNPNFCYSENTTRQEQMYAFSLLGRVHPLEGESQVDYWEWYDAEGALLKTIQGGAANELRYEDLLASELFTASGPLFMEITAKAYFRHGFVLSKTMPVGSPASPFNALTRNDIIVNNPTDGGSGYIEINATPEEIRRYVFSIEYLGGDQLAGIKEFGTVFAGAPRGLYLVTQSDGQCVSTLEVEVGGNTVSNPVICEDGLAIDKQAVLMSGADSDKPGNGSVSNIVILGDNLLGGQYYYRWNQQSDTRTLTSTSLQFTALEAGTYHLLVARADRPECAARASFEVSQRLIVHTPPTFTDDCGMVLNVYDYVDIDIDEWRDDFGDPAQYTDEQKRALWADFYESHNVCRFYNVFDEVAGVYTVLDNNPSDDDDNYGERVSLAPGDYELVIGCNDDLDPSTEAYEQAVLPEDRWIEYIEEVGGLNLMEGRVACVNEGTFLSNDFWDESDKAGQVDWYYIDASSPVWVDEQTHSDQFREGTVSASEATLAQAGWTRLVGDQWRDNSPRVSPDFTTVYGALYTRGLCESRSVSVIYTIGGLASAPVELEVCGGQTLSLNIADGVTAGTYDFVRWMDDPDAVEARTVTPGTTMFSRYQAMVEDRTGMDPVLDAGLSGCPTLIDFRVTVLGSPVEAGEEIIPACIGNTVTLSPAGGVSYEWDGTGLEDPASAEQKVKVTGDQEYLVSITNDAGCAVSKKYIIKAKTAFNPVLSVNPACLGEGRLRVDISEGTVLRWSPEPVSGQGSPSAVFDLGEVSETLIVAEARNEDGCAVEVEKEVLSPGVLSLMSSQPKVCLGKPVQLFSNRNVTWSPALGLSSNASGNPYAYVTSSTKYTASGVDVYGCPFSEEITIEVDESCACYEPNATPGEETYFWRGGAGYTGEAALFDSDWDNLNNWSLSQDAYVIPASLPDVRDNVVLEDLSGYPGQFPYPALSHDVSLNNVCVLGHRWQLNNFTARYQGDGIFSGGEVLPSNGAIIGDGGHKGGDNIAYFSGTTFGVRVDVGGVEQLYLNGSEFFSAARFEFTGDRPIYSAGGNRYHGETGVRHCGSGDLYLARTPDGKPDRYDGQVMFERRQSGELFISSAYLDDYHGNLYFIGDGFRIGAYGGGARIAGESEQFIESATERVVDIAVGRLVMDKPGFSSVNALTLNKVNVLVSGGANPSAARLELGNGHIRSNRVDGTLTLESGASYTGGGPNSFVQGPIRIIRSGTVTFPVGKRTRYMPVTLQGLPANVDGNMIEFVEENPLRADKIDPSLTAVSVHENLKYLNEYAYWVAGGQALKSAGVSVVLPWDEQSRDIPYDLGNLRVAAMEHTGGAGLWIDAGNTLTTGSQKSAGTVKSQAMETVAFAEGVVAGYALAATSDPGFESPTGFSFNSYGAALTLKKGSSLIIYGDLLNEYSGDNEAGVIENQSVIKVEDDWTNNAVSDGGSSGDETYVFAPLTGCADCPGSVYLFGNDQRIRGKERTRFHQLHLSGFGTKTMYVDTDVDDQDQALLALGDNTLHTGMFRMRVWHTSPLTITRDKTGNVKSQVKYAGDAIDGGLLIWRLDPDAHYLFPLGSERYYRPVELSYEATGPDAVVYGTRLVEEDPEDHGLWAGAPYRSPFIERINRQYYHHIERMDESAPEQGINLRFYFDRDRDGAFQSLARWGSEYPLGVYFGVQLTPFQGTNSYAYTPGVTKIWNLADGDYNARFADNMNTPASGDTPEDYIDIAGHKTVRDPYYSLVRSGIVMQSPGFGDPDGDHSQAIYKVGGESQTTGNGGLVYQTESPGAIGDSESERLNHGDLLVPDQWATVMDIEVLGDPNTAPGVIQITTDNNGRIAQNSQGDYLITYLDCSERNDPCERKILNPALYTVREGTILELRSAGTLQVCADHWVVDWNYDETSGAFRDMVVTSLGPDPVAIREAYLCPVGLQGCSGSSGSYALTPGDGAGVYVIPGGSGIAEGVYELRIELEGGGEIKGQVIYK